MMERISMWKLLTSVVCSVLLMSLKPVRGQDRTRQVDQSGTDLVISVVDQIRQSGIFPNDYDLLPRIAYVASRNGMDPETYRPDFNGGIWQIHEGTFRATQDVEFFTFLNEKLNAIQQFFDINWQTLTWGDLRRPLHSGLAASLEFCIIERDINRPVPQSIADQANYWEDFFDFSQATPQTFIDAVSSLPIPALDPNCPPSQRASSPSLQEYARLSWTPLPNVIPGRSSFQGCSDIDMAPGTSYLFDNVYTDDQGNERTCVFTGSVSYPENGGPAITYCPSNIYLMAPPGANNMTVSWATPRATVPIGRRTRHPDETSTFPLGHNLVEYVFEDRNANDDNGVLTGVSVCSFIVRILQPASWSSWTSWSTCSSCDSAGDQTRTRTCSIPGACDGDLSETRVCNCETQTRTRTRTCPIPDECDERELARQECNREPCPTWNSWTSWSTCSRSCGSGEQTRARTCTIPGQCIFGDASGTMDCNTQGCPTATQLDGDLTGDGSCGVRTMPGVQSRIVGGTDAALGDWPWIGSLKSSTGSHSCGATLIRPDLAISAAHCFLFNQQQLNDGASTPFGVVFGEQRLGTTEPSEQRRSFAQIVIHPNYDTMSNNAEFDLVLLFLSSPVTITDFVRPMCLAFNSNEAGTYSNCMVAGWGDLAMNNNMDSDMLQQVSLPLITPAVCALTPYFQTDVTTNIICAGGGTTDSCQGDSGGPLICQSNLDGALHLVGVVSVGSGCGQPNNPGFYTRISQFRTWIENPFPQPPQG